MCELHILPTKQAILVYIMHYLFFALSRSPARSLALCFIVYGRCCVHEVDLTFYNAWTVSYQQAMDQIFVLYMNYKCSNVFENIYRI